MFPIYVAICRFSIWLRFCLLAVCPPFWLWVLLLLVSVLFGLPPVSGFGWLQNAPWLKEKPHEKIKERKTKREAPCVWSTSRMFERRGSKKLDVFGLFHAIGASVFSQKGSSKSGGEASEV